MISVTKYIGKSYWKKIWPKKWIEERKLGQVLNNFFFGRSSGEGMGVYCKDDGLKKTLNDFAFRVENIKCI